MSVTIKEITNHLELFAPISSQESYDNCGLIVGNASQEASGALLSLDCTEAVVEEAIQLGVNLIIAHHPIVFKGLKKLNGKNYVERTVIKAIKNDIAIYAIHTNLDNYIGGVNAKIGALMGLENLRILAPKKGVLNKITVFVPTDASEEVAKVMFANGAGNIGNYDECSFESEGKGAFKPLDGANPTIGEVDEREIVSETKLEVLCTTHNTAQVLLAMKAAHPYEEVAHDVIPLANANHFEGAGMIGELAEPIETAKFLKQVKETFKTGCVRHTPIVHESIKTVAFCGGAGSFLIGAAKGARADIYITGDVKYHEFFDAENDLIIADIGHFESEQYTPELIHEVMKKKFINFALHLSKVNTNPINYL